MTEVGGIVVEADLREHWTGVRDQGARSSCLACATSDAHALGHGLPHPLSAEYLFYHSARVMGPGGASSGLTFEAAGVALEQEGQPNEVEWPYQAEQPQPWSAPAVSELWRGRFQEPVSTQDLPAVLHGGQPVVLGLLMVPGFYRVAAPHYIIDAAGAAVGGHAVLAVGLGRSPGGRDVDLLLIRNSWGFRWGYGGHAWLPIGYLQDKLIDCRVVAGASTQH